MLSHCILKRVFIFIKNHPSEYPVNLETCGRLEIIKLNIRAKANIMITIGVHRFCCFFDEVSLENQLIIALSVSLGFGCVNALYTFSKVSPLLSNSTVLSGNTH